MRKTLQVSTSITLTFIPYWYLVLDLLVKEG